MNLQSITHLNVDFYDKKHIIINAKQYDKSSRFILVTCYNRGEILPINSNEHSAYVRYRKSDNNSVINLCEINDNGEILVELTEQMLASSGFCHVDLVIINKGNANVNVDTGEIIAIDNSPILSTMVFCINVYETSVENSEIESTYEFNGFNEALQKAEAEYSKVVQLSKSYAVGDAGGIRENEDIDNAKYYYEQSLSSANNAKESETNAKTSETNASISEDNAKASELNALVSEQNSKDSETSASISEQNAKTSEVNSKTYMDNTESYMNNASESKTIALESANIAKSYAVGGTETRENEDVDNAKYYYEQTKGISDSLSGSLLPKGTVYFEELATVDKFTGYLYIVKDSFTTDDTFVDGAGVQYPSGTIVFYTVDGYWSCFSGFGASVATVDEVTNFLSI